MNPRVCYYADRLEYPEGGYLWKFLNWAGGLQANGCEVTWLESIAPSSTMEQAQRAIEALRRQLEPYHLGNSIAVCTTSGVPHPAEEPSGCVPFAHAVEADLLLNIGYYQASEQLLGQFRRTALIDYDPGLLQVWVSRGELPLPRYDAYFTIGETVGQANSIIPDVGVRWEYVPPCVFLDEWTPTSAAAGAAFTTVTHWWGDWLDGYENTKRAGFVPYLELPRHTPKALELAIALYDKAADQSDWAMLQQHGWQLRRSNDVTRTPSDYQLYIQNSLGEFSCAKPSCARLQNAWVSERTLCYLASGKPAVVEHTGPSRFLPDAAGLWRFRNLPEAVDALERVVGDYPNQCRLARQLAEEYFDARKVLARVLEVALS